MSNSNRNQDSGGMQDGGWKRKSMWWGKGYNIKSSDCQGHYVWCLVTLLLSLVDISLNSFSGSILSLSSFWQRLEMASISSFSKPLCSGSLSILSPTTNHSSLSLFPIKSSLINLYKIKTNHLLKLIILPTIISSSSNLSTRSLLWPINSLSISKHFYILFHQQTNFMYVFLAKKSQFLINHSNY